MNKINFQNLPNTTTPVTATNLNQLQTNVENTLNTYSTSEIRIGTWVNNKPLYRKVIDIGTLPNNTNTDVATGLNNVIVQNIYGRAYNSTSTNSIPLPYAAPTDAYVTIAFNNKNVRTTTGTDRTAWTGYVVLEYTKTTD